MKIDIPHRIAVLWSHTTLDSSAQRTTELVLGGRIRLLAAERRADQATEKANRLRSQHALLVDKLFHKYWLNTWLGLCS